MENLNNTAIPQGLKYALQKNSQAQEYFNSLPAETKNQIINNTHQIQSKSQMTNFVDNLFDINMIG